MSTRRPRPIKDYLITGVIVLAGLAAGYLGFVQARDQVGEDVLDSSRHSAVAFLSPDLPALTATDPDPGSGIDHVGCVLDPPAPPAAAERKDGPSSPALRPTSTTARSVPALISE